MAGTPESRAAELNAMFTDENVDAIICLRGGYGTPQILKLLDYEKFAKNPKLFIGYSDLTALHIAFLQNAQLATIHGPMASSGITSLNSFSKSYFLRALTKPEPLGRIVNPDGEEIHCLIKGQARGTIIGGDLAQLQWARLLK